MTDRADYIPERYHTLTPYLIVSDAELAIEFYAAAFNAVEVERHRDAEGRTEHAEVQIGDSIVMMSEEYEYEGLRAQAPQTVSAATAHVYLYVEDVDAATERAVGAGATLVVPVTDQYWGDRIGGVADPFGHIWWIATPKEDLTPEEAQQRLLERTSASTP
jgi:PhnB protein